MLTEGDINQEQHDWAASRGLGLKAGKLYKRSASRTSSATCATS